MSRWPRWTRVVFCICAILFILYGLLFWFVVAFNAPGGPDSASRELPVVYTKFYNQLSIPVIIGTDLTLRSYGGSYTLIQPSQEVTIGCFHVKEEVFPLYDAHKILIGGVRPLTWNTDTVIYINQTAIGDMPMKSLSIENKLDHPVEIDIGYSCFDRDQKHLLVSVKGNTLLRIPGKRIIRSVFPIYGSRKKLLGAIQYEEGHPPGDKTSETITITKEAIKPFVP